jgi:hypothetical protein
MARASGMPEMKLFLLLIACMRHSGKQVNCAWTRRARVAGSHCASGCPGRRRSRSCSVSSRARPRHGLPYVCRIPPRRMYQRLIESVNLIQFFCSLFSFPTVGKRSREIGFCNADQRSMDCYKIRKARQPRQQWSELTKLDCSLD